MKWFRKSNCTRAPSTHRARPCLEGLESRVVPYTTSGNSWPHPALITLSFVPDGTVLGNNNGTTIYSNLFSSFNSVPGWTTAIWQKQILKGAQAWAQQTNINIAVVSDNGAAIGAGNYQQGDPGMGDIRIGGYNFGSLALGVAYMPPPVNNYSLAGDLDFNTGQPFNIGTTYDLFSVSAHEIGHALGLYHSNTLAVMNAIYALKLGLTADDVSGIRAIYSSGSARSLDSYDAAASNNTFATASNITAQIDPTALTALLPNLDLTSINSSTGAQTTADVDYYTFTAPTNSSSTLSVLVQSAGLSLLAPNVTVYAADQTTVLGSASGAGQYGATLTVTVTGVTPGQQFYVKVSGSETDTLGSGKYALGLNFGTGAMPTVTPPNTQTANGNPLTSGGGQNETVGPAGGAGDIFDPTEGETPASAGKTSAPATPVVILPIQITPQAPATNPILAVSASSLLSRLPNQPLDSLPSTRLDNSPLHVGTSEGQATVLPASDDPTPAPTPPPATSPEAEGAVEPTASEWRAAREACLGDYLPASFAEDEGALAPTAEETSAALQSPEAAAAVLLVAFGGYWARPPEESERRRSRVT